MKKKVYRSLIYRIFIIALLFNSAFEVMAQEVVATNKGTISIRVNYNDSIFLATSNQLQINLNYQTAKFNMSLDISTLKTGQDSLDSIFDQAKNKVILIEGALDIDIVQTHDHPIQEFAVEGYLICGMHNELLKGKGRLEHVYGDVYSCILTIVFELDLTKSQIDLGVIGLSDKISVI